MRTTLLAAMVAVVFAVACTATASGEASPWAAYVAPATACAGFAHAHSVSAAQQGEMVCLVNWTRRRAGLRALRWSPVLGRAAGSKADVIASCDDFSHYPCGTRWPAMAAKQHRYDVWGENLFFGARRVSTARTALVAWLESPEHRAVLFGRSWRDVGVTVRGVSALRGNADVNIWVLEVAGRTRSLRH